MQKIFNIMLATAMMLFIISCSKEESNPAEPETIVTNSMVLIPAGTFLMGNTGTYYFSYEEYPVHPITISRSFYMSKYEVTQSQYETVMGINPSNFKGVNLPVEVVSWYDAVAFCNALSRLEKKTPCYTINGKNVTCNWEANGYRLPTEAEWEYAAKAGTTADLYSGIMTYSDSRPLDSNLNKIGWYWGNANHKTQTVGQKQPNKFGLYDMSGNVGEWCWDTYGLYPSGDTSATKEPTIGFACVIRGGCWRSVALSCRSANREGYSIDRTYDYVGFRIVRVGE